jgi:glycine/D-amino acid oxidase-like deaminating enzyme/sarcosine oxidase gamma subunit
VSAAREMASAPLGEPVDPPLPREVRVVVVGGGIVGASVAYQLAKAGWRDVLLLEQGRLSGGTTWHAAGLVGRFRTGSAMVRINDASARLYASLEQETGSPTGWRQVGSLLLAQTEERMVQYRRAGGMAEYFGVGVEYVSADDARQRWPLIRHEDLVGAAWLPGDGVVHPQKTALALARGAEMRGAVVREHVRVTDVLRTRRRARGVRTSAGDVAAEAVVLCAGMWSRQLGLQCGVTIPLYPVEHHYVVSNPIEDVHSHLPCVRDMDSAIYFRSEGNQIILGAFQKYTKPWMVERVPDDFAFTLLAPDWEHFAEPLARGQERIPALRASGIERFVNGPESFTPDNHFLIGESPEMDGLYVAAGFNSAGIACAGAAGEVLAQWIIGGEPPMDLWPVDIRRVGPYHNTRAFLRARVSETLGLHSRMAWPNYEAESGRGLRRGALHERLEQRGACFGSRMGIERPLWFAAPGARPAMEYSFGRQNWFDRHAAEHRAAREGVAVFDQSSFAKYVFTGRDVAGVLQRLCGNDVDVPVGRLVYTGLLNARGTFESDLTVVRLADDAYYIVTATTQAVRDYHWITRDIDEEEDAHLVDVTSGSGVLGVMGPNARRLLAPLTDADLSSAAFPFFIKSGRYTLDVAGAHYPARASLAPLYDPKNEKILV